MRPTIAMVALLLCGCDEWQTASKADLRRLELRVLTLEARAKEHADDDHVREDLMATCLGGAEDAYWDHVKLNGRRRPGTDVWTAPAHIFDHAAKLKQSAIEECRVKHGR